MPKAPETDPAILAQRLVRKRAFAKERTRQYRARIKDRVDSLLSTALDQVAGAPVDPDTLHNPSVPPAVKRTARAILRRALTRHGVTLDRVVSEIRSALDATKLRQVGAQIVSQKDYQATLRAADQSLKLLERSGEVPGSKESQMPQDIRINIMVLSGSGEAKMVPLGPLEPAREAPIIVHAGSSRDQALQNRGRPRDLAGAGRGDSRKRVNRVRHCGRGHSARRASANRNRRRPPGAH